MQFTLSTGSTGSQPHPAQKVLPDSYYLPLTPALPSWVCVCVWGGGGGGGGGVWGGGGGGGGGGGEWLATGRMGRSGILGSQSVAWSIVKMFCQILLSD